MASHRSGQRMTESTRKKSLRLHKPSCSRPWHRNIVVGKETPEGRHCVGQDMVRQVRDKPRTHRWDAERRHGGENTPKTGTDKTP